MSLIQEKASPGEIQSINSIHMHAEAMVKTVNWAIEEAIPLNLMSLEEEKDPEFDATIWVHQNIIRVSKEFSEDFHGGEKEAFELFTKIDNKRQGNKGKSTAQVI